MLYENDANAKPKLKTQGLSTKRRDVSFIVKRVYGEILNIILTKNDVQGSIEYLFKELKRLIEGEVGLEEFILSKTLRGYYKDPTKIAHRMLADRIGVRDPGNKPAVNDRIPYIYIKVAGDTPVLQGDRIETPEYIREHNLTPDYLHYITNQLLKPISQLYALCVESLPGYNYPADHWETQKQILLASPTYNNEKKCKKKIMDMKIRVVEHLLFKAYIDSLGGKCKRLTANAPSASSPKKSPKKKYETEIGPNAPTLTLSVIEDKEAKIYKCSAKYTMAAPIIGLEDFNIEIPKTGARGRGGCTTKEACFRKIAERAFAAITEAEAQNELEEGLRVCIDKAPIFVNIWNERLYEYKTPPDESKLAPDPTDIGAISDEIMKQSLFNILVKYIDVFNYNVSATPKK